MHKIAMLEYEALRWKPDMFAANTINPGNTDNCAKEFVDPKLLAS
jgi:hypothetical protein